MDIIKEIKPVNIEPILKPVDGTMQFDPENWDYSISYDSVIDSYGFNKLHSEFLGSYQGDALFLLHDKASSKYGLLVFGYGSCSGCDSLQGCSTTEEVVGLREQLFDQITWKSKGDLLEYLNTHDWEGDWLNYYGNELTEALITLKEILNK